MSHRVLDLLSGRDRSLPSRLLCGVLSCLTPPYRAVVALRNLMFDFGIRRPHALPRPVISVGNVTTGGTGKTPLVIELVRRLEAMGARPAVLLRGYHGYRVKATIPAESPEPESTVPAPRYHSDEQTMYEAVFEGRVPVAADPDRIRSARWVVTHHPGVDIFLLDDAFQRRQVRRDLDLVLIDATRPFGFDRLLPRGLLREPMANLQRADAIIITHADEIEPAQLEALKQRLITITGRPPVAAVAHHWAGLRDVDDRILPLTELMKVDPYAVCGIANPPAFAQALRRHSGREHIELRALADHHHYTARELRQYLAQAEKAGQVLVTTDKDWAKWKPLLDWSTAPAPVYRPVLELTFIEGEAALTRLLQQTLATRPQ